MVYDLLVTGVIEVPVGQFSTALPDLSTGLNLMGEIWRGNEVVRGLPFKVALSITNMSQVDFPGGIFKRYRVKTSGMTDALDEPPRVPQIPAGQKAEISEQEFLLFEEGLSWLQLQIESEDGEEIHYHYKGYRASKATSGENEWVVPIFIVNRELMLLLAWALEGRE